jgi:TRAP-type C4-dicarboxylate transport system substrate-binding protein
MASTNLRAVLFRTNWRAALLLWAAAPFAAAHAETALSMATEYPADSMPGLGVAEFAQRVQALTHGAVVVRPSYDAALGIKSASMIDAVQSRRLDAGDAFAGALAAQYPLFGLSSLPFVADSLVRAQALEQAARPTYEKLLAAHGLKLLYTTPWPASGLWSKRPVDSVAALQSLRVRTYDPTSQVVMRSAGAQAFNISFADAMPRIAAGEVDSVLSSGDGGAGRKLWNQLPYFAEINYAMPLSVATINLEAYRGLDPAGQRAVDQAAADTEAAQWRRVRVRLARNYEAMRRNGVIIDRHPPEAVRSAMARAAEGAVRDWLAQTGPEGIAVLQRYQDR